MVSERARSVDYALGHPHLAGKSRLVLDDSKSAIGEAFHGRFGEPYAHRHRQLTALPLHSIVSASEGGERVKGIEPSFRKWFEAV
jgi:hypothetical protein